MAYGTANSYARPRRRRRKRKSHYGVLALVIVLLIALIVLAVKLVTTAVSAVIGRTGTHEIVYQVTTSWATATERRSTLRRRLTAIRAATCSRRSSLCAMSFRSI